VHPFAPTAALAAESAGDYFWEMVWLILNRPGFAAARAWWSE
jgi:hypothetical protein